METGFSGRGAFFSLQGMSKALIYRERPAAGSAEGLLVLHHGRGADESDLLPLANVLDPDRRLHVVTPRAPLEVDGGYHWYGVPRVGYPDPQTFSSAYRQLADLHDGLWQRTGVGPAQTVLGGFSMGAVMSYSLGLAGERPAPAGILAFSGFIPVVEGWHPSLADRLQLRAFIAHGRKDPVIEVGFAHRAYALLEQAGLAVEYHESDVSHRIDLPHIAAATAWLMTTFSDARSPA
jgi:phospholipase/carboxylesterase